MTMTDDELVTQWKRLLKCLSYREREIIKLRYGFGDDYKYTLEEVGHIFKVTRERIRQIEIKAKSKITALLETDRFRDISYQMKEKVLYATKTKQK